MIEGQDQPETFQTQSASHPIAGRALNVAREPPRWWRMSCSSLPPPIWRQLASIIHGPLSPACLPVGHPRAVSTRNRYVAVFFSMASHGQSYAQPLELSVIQFTPSRRSPGDGSPSWTSPKNVLESRGFLTVLWRHSTDSKLGISRSDLEKDPRDPVCPSRKSQAQLYSQSCGPNHLGL